MVAAGGAFVNLTSTADGRPSTVSGFDRLNLKAMADLNDILARAGAETITYDRWEIANTFGEPQAEYAAIRKAAGLIDLPFRGVLEFTGKDRHVFLNNLVSNQTFDKNTKEPPRPGSCNYAFLLNLGGRIVADLNILEFAEKTWVEVDARLLPMLTKFFDDYVFGEKMTITPLDSTHALALHGPNANGVLALETGVELAPGECRTVSFLGRDVAIFRDDVCGEIGIEFLVPSDGAGAIWQHLVNRHGGLGERQGGDPKRTLKPIGWAAFNACRIEAGRPLFGIDFELAEPTKRGPKQTGEPAEKSRGVLPAETGLVDRAVSFTKGCYLGQEVVARMHARGQFARKLVGLRIDGGYLPTAGEPVLDAGHQPIGIVTSSTMSPLLGDAAIALAIVKKPFFEIGKTVVVPAEGAMRDATVVTLPFIKKDSQ